jgi:hypothetical protein
MAIHTFVEVVNQTERETERETEKETEKEKDNGVACQPCRPQYLCTSNPIPIPRPKVKVSNGSVSVSYQASCSHAYSTYFAVGLF